MSAKPFTPRERRMLMAMSAAVAEMSLAIALLADAGDPEHDASLTFADRADAYDNLRRVRRRLRRFLRASTTEGRP